MAPSIIQKEIQQELSKLLPEQQFKVLEILKEMNHNGDSIQNFLKYRGKISKKDLDIIKLAIEKSCEGIDPNDW